MNSSESTASHSTHSSDSTMHSSHNDPPINPTPIIRKYSRVLKPRAYLEAYHCNLLSNTIHPPFLPASSSSAESCKYPLSSCLSYQHLSSAHKHFALSLSSSLEPTNYDDAMCLKNWKNAVKVELEALNKNNTWKLTSLPAHKKAIGCKWIFKLKLHANDTIERYKARLVAKGFTQTKGIDYMDTFSPVVKMTTIRVLISIVASQNWSLYQLDVNTAFLHGDLNEEVYMQPPPGLILSAPNHVCKLQRSLYGLKQESKQWNTKLTETLISSDYTQSKADYSLFTKKSINGFTVILVYVDDLVLGGREGGLILQRSNK